VQVLLGLKTDLPLLGDVDGDGGRFLCHTVHDGGGAGVSVAFGLAGGTPLLGDMDGDGREDFCVFGGALPLRGARDVCKRVSRSLGIRVFRPPDSQ
jgi:hypothetical protein